MFILYPHLIPDFIIGVFLVVYMNNIVVFADSEAPNEEQTSETST